MVAAAYGQHMLLERYMEICDSMPEKANQIFNLRYQDLMKDPIRAVGTIFSNWGLPFTDEARRRMQAYIDRNPKGGHGKHQYSFEETGLDLEEERAKFAPYQARFDVPSEV